MAFGLQAEQHEKQMQYMAATKDIHRHMLGQMAELKLKKKDVEVLDQEMLKQRIIQDQKVQPTKGHVLASWLFSPFSGIN